MARECVRQCPEIKRLAARPARSLRDQRRFSRDLRQLIARTITRAETARFAGDAAGGAFGGLLRHANLAGRGFGFLYDGRAALDLPRCLAAIEASYGCEGPTAGTAGAVCPLVSKQGEPEAG
jgi:hypothetical protein